MLIDGFKAKPGAELDLQDSFARYTLDSIAEIAFGVTLGAMTSDGQDFQQALASGDITGATFGRAFDAAQSAVVWRFFLPFWGIRRFLQVGMEKQLNVAAQVVNTFCHKLITDRRKEGDLEGNKDVLSWFMLLEDEEGKPYPDEYLRDIIMNFMIAGRDTTSNALTWAFHMLAKHPECVTKVREELASLGVDQPGAVISHQIAKSMKYTEAVMKETLRLYPPVPKDMKQAVEDDTLPDGTLIRAGQLVCYLPIAQGRSNRLWGKEAGCPHEADVFYPERWMDEDFKPNMFYYPVFQAGLRTCLGKDMALLEAKTLLAMIVREFDFERTGDEPAFLNSVTLPVRGGLFGKLSPRGGMRN